MVKTLRIKKVGINETQLIRSFLLEAPETIKSFRYFQNRTLDVVSNHIITIIALSDNKVVGYGHLDKELNTIWFGIAVADSFKGKGIGKKLMKYLIDYADNVDIPVIKLSVDVNNIVAIKMYEKCNFIVEKKLTSDVLLMKRTKGGL
ncbi:GNAT family N-acetyltransferase [Schleiferiaceae bacterium]|nr:GNAT family N-acetyltransferase [Schleiferiaceae bacterium]